MADAQSQTEYMNHPGRGYHLAQVYSLRHSLAALSGQFCLHWPSGCTEAASTPSVKASSPSGIFLQHQPLRQPSAQALQLQPAMGALLANMHLALTHRTHGRPLPQRHTVPMMRVHLVSYRAPAALEILPAGT